ncbi:MAG: hypothetical protein DDT19_00063 [Syntrophomonadaceae bacterium]|nr:hypothetical protein [Bacillota bacterium]
MNKKSEIKPHDNLLDWTLELDHIQLMLKKQAEQLQRISEVLFLLVNFLRSQYRAVLDEDAKKLGLM